MFDPPLPVGRPRVVTPMRPTEDDPQAVVMWEGWEWWLDAHDPGLVCARGPGGVRVQARNFTALLATIRKREAEGGLGGRPDH